MRAKVIADSVSSVGHRLTTMEVVMHRFVLAEFNTHRVFSRNSASSRAIPVTKQLERLRTLTATPIEWPMEQAGMQGGTHLDGENLAEAQELWDTTEQMVLGLVEAYVSSHPDSSTRLHKSLLNRLMEPFMYHTVIVSSTEWANFFEQRCSPLAQPEIRVVAEDMQKAYRDSHPTNLAAFEWHTPYIQGAEYSELMLEQRIKVSVARCARVSYLTHDGVRDIEADISLFDKLVSAKPAHLSPLEHVARPLDYIWDEALLGNFVGWQQIRHCADELGLAYGSL